MEFAGFRARAGLDLQHEDPVAEPKRASEKLPAVVKQLFSELQAIEARISQISEQSSALDEYLYANHEQRSFYAWVKTAYAERQARKLFFKNPDVLGEPCWDIILDLTKAELEGKRISVTSACIASGVPPTTALRWIAVLEKEGIIERSSDQQDKRRVFVRMSETGMRLIHAYYLRIRSTG